MVLSLSDKLGIVLVLIVFRMVEVAAMEVAKDLIQKEVGMIIPI
jgi:hypothetical protein